MITIDIKTMSNRQLETLAQDISVELRERKYRIYEDAITHNVYVGEIEEKYRQGYLDYLEETAGPGQSPASREILLDWYAQEDMIQSRKTTGA